MWSVRTGQSRLNLQTSPQQTIVEASLLANLSRHGYIVYNNNDNNNNIPSNDKCVSILALRLTRRHVCSDCGCFSPSELRKGIIEAQVPKPCRRLCDTSCLPIQLMRLMQLILTAAVAQKMKLSNCRQVDTKNRIAT